MTPCAHIDKNMIFIVNFLRLIPAAQVLATIVLNSTFKTANVQMFMSTRRSSFQISNTVLLFSKSGDFFMFQADDSWHLLELSVRLQLLPCRFYYLALVPPVAAMSNIALSGRFFSSTVITPEVFNKPSIVIKNRQKLRGQQIAHSVTRLEIVLRTSGPDQD